MVDGIHGGLLPLVVGLVIATGKPGVNLGPEEAQALAVFVVRDTPERNPVIDRLLGGVVLVVGAKSVNVHPLILDGLFNSEFFDKAFEPTC